jgi:hypothetical protein
LRTALLLGVCVPMLCGLTGCEPASRAWSEAKILEFMQGCDRIELVLVPGYSDSKGEHLPVSLELQDPDAVRGIVSLVALEPKQPCLCDHVQTIRFHSGTSSLTAAICSHCFDVRPPGKRPGTVQHYCMPDALWARFLEYGTQRRRSLDAGEQERLDKWLPTE